MVAYLNTSDANKGFNQVIDFLNGSYIKYALTVNPTIYVTCIKQFWNTVVVKQSNDVTRVGKGFLRVEMPSFEGMLVVGEHEEQGDAEEQYQVDEQDGIEFTVVDLALLLFIYDYKLSHTPSDTPNPTFNFSLLIITTIIMAPLTFADTYNMIAFLTKSDAIEGFDQIVDFLNAYNIQYALMVNPTIYVSCIKQFWALILIKKSNDAMKLQALIDRKKVIITEDTIRQNLRLDDADGIDCLPNDKTFVELAWMGYEKLSTRRIGKGFLRVKTPLFDAMLAPQQVQDDVKVQEDEDDNEVPTAPTSHSPTPATTPPPPQQEPIPSPPQAQSAQPSSPPQQQPSQPTDILESFMTLFNKLMKTCDTLTQKVANLEQDKIAQALEITKLKQRVRKLEKKRKFKSSSLKRMAESQIKVYNLDLQHFEKVLSMKDINEAEPAEVEEVLEVVTTAKLITEIVANDDEDVYTEATPLASKKGRYGLAKVNSWKLFESCGVHIITLTTTQMILLVEKIYPLTRFTLEQMLNNVRLEVKEESEISLELLSFGVDAVQEFKKMH
nr:hypothetical protein [Tanacetum cinerariifolium]